MGALGLNKGQRKGVLGLVLVIVVVQCLIFWRQNSVLPQAAIEIDEVALQQIDSLNKLKQEGQKPKIYPFNPNYITDYRGYVLGMSVEEIDRLHAFREQDQWVNSVREFQQVTQVSDSLLKEISPYFQFPDWVVNRENNPNKSIANKSDSQVLAHRRDLNQASVGELKEIKGIGEVLANRIVRYRAQIKGFRSDIQLKDIYGLKYETRMALLQKFEVSISDDLEKLNLNTASTVELLEVPYFNYELARKIVDYRITHEGFQTFEQLAEIESFPYDKIESVKLYLKM